MDDRRRTFWRLLPWALALVFICIGFARLALAR